MFVEIIFAITLGVFAGIITGLVPGIHINLVSLLLVSSVGFLQPYMGLIAIACFIISMSVVHSYLDPIPSIYLGAPESDQVLGVLPGHRYLLAGHGYVALKLTVIGSLGATIMSIIFFPVFLFIVKYLYDYVSAYIGYLLVAVIVFMILRDNKKLWAFFIFAISGTLGLIVLNLPGLENPLFPMLSGLFGISTLLISLNESSGIPPQKIKTDLKIPKKLLLKSLLSGQLSGFLTAILPGVGSATAAVISLQITKNLGDKGFMILTGSINTVNFILSLITLYLYDKARNGAVIAIKEILPEINLSVIILFLAVTLIAAGASIYLALNIAKKFSKLITKINYSLTIKYVIGLLIVMTYILTGWKGLLVLVVATAIGIIPGIVKVTRTQGMGCIMLPVALYFLL